MQQTYPLLLQVRYRGWHGLAVALERPRTGVLAMQVLRADERRTGRPVSPFILGLQDIDQRHIVGEVGGFPEIMPTVTCLPDVPPQPYRVAMPVEEGLHRPGESKVSHGLRQPRPSRRIVYQGLECQEYRMVGCTVQAYLDYYPKAVEAYLVIARAVRAREIR